MSERREFYSSRPIHDPITILVQAYQSVWLGRIYDGSDAPSVAFAVGAWLGKGVMFRLMRLSITARLTD
jgi:hypothetical protein